MLRRPKVQFKPKISTGCESKPVQGKSTPVKQLAPTVAESDVCDVSNYVAIETTEVSVDASLLVAIDPGTPIPHTHTIDPGTPIPHTHTIVIEPREVPLINIPSSQSSIPSTSPTKRTRGSKTTVEIVGEDNDSVTPRKQSNSLQKHSTSTSRQLSGQSSRKRPKICLSSSKQNLPLDRSKVTMYDLLSYNPPLSEEQKERRRKEREEASASDSDREERSSAGESPFKVPSPVKSVLKSRNSPPPSQQSSSQQSSSQQSSPQSECVLKSHNSLPPSQESTTSECDASNGSPSKVEPGKVEPSGPRVKIGADGNIVIDEESLIVRRVDVSLSEVTVINEGKVGTSSTNYESFRKRKTTRNRWTEDETVKFYHALSAIGTDFSLMADTFFRDTRTREELRNKFKKEEKTKTHLIDSAMAQTNLKYATDYLEKVNKNSSPSKSDGNKSPSKSQQSSSSKRQLSPTRKSPRHVS